MIFVADKTGFYGVAQRNLVGSLLYDGSSSGRVLEITSYQDFEEPSLAAIMYAITQISRRDEKVSVVTVAKELESLGDLEKVGGTAGLFTLYAEGEKALLSATPETYASVVREASAKRSVAQRLKEGMDAFKFSSGTSAKDGISQLQNDLSQEMLKLADDATTVTVSDYMDSYFDVLQERERISNENKENAEGLQGIPSLIKSLNTYTSGFMPQQLITVGARTGVGKALSIDTPILTLENGWVTMGDIVPGFHHVPTVDGSFTLVSKATEVMHDRPCYRLSFSNGKTIVADAEHLWSVKNGNERKNYLSSRVLTTLELQKHFSENDKWSIDAPESFHGNDSFNPVLSGHYLGRWVSKQYKNKIWIKSSLLQGFLSYARSLRDDDIVIFNSPHRLTDKNKHTVREMRKSIEKSDDESDDINESNSYIYCDTFKIIDFVTLVAPSHYKREFLSGVLNVLGEIQSDGTVSLCTDNNNFAESLLSLMVSQGIPAVFEENVNEVARYKIYFKKNHTDAGNDVNLLFIEKIEPVDSVPVRCIEVEHDSHMFLAGRALIPTHNSVFAVMQAIAAAKAKKTVMFFSLEMSHAEIVDRIVANLSGVSLNKLKNGYLDEVDREKVKNAGEQMKSMNIIIDTDPGASVDSVRSKAMRQAQSKDGLDMIILDYLQLLSSSGRYNNRQQEVADLSRNMKLLAKTLQIPVMILTQLNRAKKDEDENPIPTMDNIRESGAIAQDSDIVILLHRDNNTDNTTPHTLVILEKNRSGVAHKTIRCHSNLENSMFREIMYSKDVDEDGQDFDMSDEDLSDLDADIDLDDI